MPHGELLDEINKLEAMLTGCRQGRAEEQVRIRKLEAALRSLQGYGLEFEDTKTVTIALDPWREAMKVLE